eukprot:CAMPEP_0197076716 /NCGR_PEP_ID=MMETSP1384-20130603/212256_1 /TAXON_ID=29189 /ORGANISM="Ammonia sp." /LENGTH=382 /DNA_ID=CAMNT_0042515575 /DNA_START=28 /DNA_END=1176 /DNA_ORIENTATION=+
MANQYSHSQQHLFAQQGPMHSTGSRSPSPQPFSAPSNTLSPQQQQWMRQQYQQQYGSMPSTATFNDMMAEHQRQWQEHIAMASPAQKHPLQQVPNTSSLSLPAQHNMNQPPPSQQQQQQQQYTAAQYAAWMKQYQQQQHNAFSANQPPPPQQQQQQQQQYTAAQYAAWMKQYQQQQHNAFSAMNMQNYQQHMAQQQAIAMRNYQQRLSMQQQQQQHSQRSLFQQQAAQNYPASTGNLAHSNQNAFARNSQVNRNQFMSQNRIYEMKEEEEEEDAQHESFVPPAPQSQDEIAKYVQWKARRQGIAEQKKVDAEVKRQQELAALAVEQKKRDGFTSATKVSKKEIDAFKQPLLSEEKRHKESEIDYALANEQESKSGGCCCLVM